MAATAEDLARLVVSIELSQAKTEKQAAAIAKAAERAARKIDGDFASANDNVARSFERGGKRVERSLGSQRAAVSNLSFQLNDIAMGLASGTSPFTIMVQQGSQVSQALQGSGGLIGAVKTLGGAFATMVNPVSLASFALIGLTGYAVQYFSNLKSEVPDTNELLKTHGEIIRSFDEAYGIASEGVKKYTDAAKQIELLKLKDEFGSLGSAAKDAAGDISDNILGRSVDEFEGATQSIEQFRAALRLLDKDTPDFREFALAMSAIESSGAPDSVKALAKEVRLSAQESIALQEAIEGAQKRLDNVETSSHAVKAAFVALTSAALGLGEGGQKAIGSIAERMTGELIPATQQAIRELATYFQNFQKLQKMVEQRPLNTLAPLVSGGGQFLNPDQMQTFKSGQAGYEAAGSSAAAQMLRGFEGFIAKAKWDVNAFRVGFGSDTTTRANGFVEKVTKDTIVSLDDAERDLSRRIVEFQSGIQDAIGVDTWRSLSDAQQAALTSIAYNYGSLPKAIVAAIQSGGGPAVVAKAIAGLSANPGRRKDEAQAYLSGTGTSMSEIGIGGKRTPADLFQGDIAQVEKKIALLNAEYEAQAKLNPLVNDYGYAVEKARIEQQLLSEAQAAGLTITPELASKISGLAESYAKASVASEQLKTSQGNLQETMKQSSAFGKDLLGGFISDLREGKSATEALANALNKVVDKLIEVGLNSLFDGAGPAGGGGGILGGLFSFLFAKNGGVYAGGKMQPMKTFARGGVSKSAAIFGEAGPEAAVPLPDGRRIPVDLRAPSVPGGRSGAAASQPVAINVNVDGANGDDHIVKLVRQGVQMGISQYDKQLDRGFAGKMARTQARVL